MFKNYYNPSAVIRRELESLKQQEEIYRNSYKNKEYDRLSWDEKVFEEYNKKREFYNTDRHHFPSGKIVILQLRGGEKAYLQCLYTDKNGCVSGECRIMLAQSQKESDVWLDDVDNIKAIIPCSQSKKIYQAIEQEKWCETGKTYTLLLNGTRTTCLIEKHLEKMHYYEIMNQDSKEKKYISRDTLKYLLLEEEEYNQGEINAVTNAIDNVYKISDKYYKKNYSRWEIHCIYIVSLITFVVLFFQNQKINALYLAIGAVFVGGLFGGVAGAFLDERFGTMKRGVKYWLICMIASCAVVGVLALLLFLYSKYK